MTRRPMNHELIAFRATEMPAAAEAPLWIMYAPAGKHEISAKLAGRQKRLRVIVDAKTAMSLQRDLTARLAQDGPKPFFDFHHEGRDAAAYPLEFQWLEPGGAKPGGVYVKVSWTDKGSAAVTCAAGHMPAVRYFSPRANYDAGTERITGLMPEDTGNAAGGIVSDPAFVKISPLTAAKAAQADQQQNNEKDTDTSMKIEMLAALAAAGLLTEAEAAQDNAHELVASRAAAMKKSQAPADNSAEITAMRAELDATRNEMAAIKDRAADKFVGDLVASGRIPAKAEGIKKVWKQSHLADAAQAEKDAKELTAAKALNPAPLTEDDTSGGAASAVNWEAVTATAHGLVASKACPDFTTAFDQARSAALTAAK